jgi:hypothetical protein
MQINGINFQEVARRPRKAARLRVRGARHARGRCDLQSAAPRVLAYPAQC